MADHEERVVALTVRGVITPVQEAAIVTWAEGLSLELLGLEAQTHVIFDPYIDGNSQPHQPKSVNMPLTRVVYYKDGVKNQDAVPPS